MRKGQNPVKQIQCVAKPSRVNRGGADHIPFLEGFLSDMLAVLNLSLQSLRDHAGMEFDLLVYDNGSCKEARDFLFAEFERGHIQTLLLSDRNMGKGGAWNVMLQAAPGEIIAYADNDVLYYPNWLVESVKLLEAYPMRAWSPRDLSTQSLNCSLPTWIGLPARMTSRSKKDTSQTPSGCANSG
jgi:cellulose synthase/poly-beta-1,6-N-acetylglucosamine synthase-like glycosyltransferase